MKLLILGGTSFLGRHLAAEAIEAGHELTLFHRGKTNPGLFPRAEEILGDRATDLALLDGREFDAVFDTCGYLPKIVRRSVQAFGTRARLYVFVSSISVYPVEDWPGVTEDSPTLRASDPETDTFTMEAYGELKAACDDLVLRELPGRALVIRPGLIVGPHDPSDRFTYWLRRIAEGGDVAAPLPQSRRIGFVDARDLAAFMLACAEGSRTGLLNAVGPIGDACTMGEFLQTCREVAGSDARFNWLPAEFLAEHAVEPPSDMPLFIPGQDDAFDCSPAARAGFTTRPLIDTVRDTLRWDDTRPRIAPLRAGLTRARERDLLAAWGRRGG